MKRKPKTPLKALIKSVTLDYQEASENLQGNYLENKFAGKRNNNIEGRSMRKKTKAESNITSEVGVNPNQSLEGIMHTSRTDNSNLGQGSAKKPDLELLQKQKEQLEL